MNAFGELAQDNLPLRDGRFRRGRNSNKSERVKDPNLRDRLYDWRLRGLQHDDWRLRGFRRRLRIAIVAQAQGDGGQSRWDDPLQ